MVKDGEDWNGLQTTNLTSLAKLFKRDWAPLTPDAEFPRGRIFSIDTDEQFQIALPLLQDKHELIGKFWNKFCLGISHGKVDLGRSTELSRNMNLESRWPVTSLVIRTCVVCQASNKINNADSTKP